MKNSKLIIRIFTLLLLVYYMLLAWLTHRTGFEHSEALFYSEKVRLLFETKENTLIILGTTYPAVAFLLALVFSPLGYLYAPIAASICIAALLFFVICRDFNKHSKVPPAIWMPLVIGSFLLHPGLIFAAISGRSVAVSLLCFYMVFRSIFRYYENQTTFYLSMASLFLTMLIFCNFSYIWLLISFFPFIVLIALEGVKVFKEQPPISQYYESVNNRSLRRKLGNRTASIYLIIFMLPLGAIYLFRTLNEAHAGSPDYFLNSQYANWRVTGSVMIDKLLNVNKINEEEVVIGSNVLKQTQIVFQFYILLLTPILIAAFYFYKGKLYELFTILSPFLLIGILLIGARYYFTVEYYLMFFILGLITISYYVRRETSFALKRNIILIAGVLNILTGIYYFIKSNDPQERKFFNALIQYEKWQGERTKSEDAQVAAFIEDIADKNNKILIDDAAAYEILAHIKTFEGVVLPQQQSFVTVVENPALVVRYMCIAKRHNSKHNYTVLNSYNLEQMSLRLLIKPLLMFETENWVIYRVG